MKIVKNWIIHLSLWPSGIGMYLGWNRLRVRVLAVSDTYPMFLEPTITWVPAGVLWVDMAWYKNCVLKKLMEVSLTETFLTGVACDARCSPSRREWTEKVIGHPRRLPDKRPIIGTKRKVDGQTQFEPVFMHGGRQQLKIIK